MGLPGPLCIAPVLRLLLCLHNTIGGGAVASTCAFIPAFTPYHTLLCIGSSAGGAPAHAAPLGPALPVDTAVAVPACLLCLSLVVCILCSGAADQGCRCYWARSAHLRQGLVACWRLNPAWRCRCLM